MARGKKKEELTLEEKLEQALVPVEEQPYEVPENWCWVRLKEICEFERGITFPASSKERVETEDNRACLRTANIQDELEIDDLIYVNKGFMKNNDSKLVRKNDIIMSTANSRELVGKVSYVHNVIKPMTFGGFLLNIRAKKVLNKYLFYRLKFEFLTGKFRGESTQTTNIANINTKTLGNCYIPLPPLQEQQRIVEQIESLFAKLDEAKEKVQEVIDGYAIRETTILQKAVSGELTKGWREKNGISKKAWKVISLKECGNWFGGGTPAKSKNVYWDGGTIPWITSKDMKDRLVEDSLLHITQEGVNHSSAQYCDKPAVLFVMRSGILRRILPVCMVRVPFTVNQDLKAVIPEKIQLEYMYWACTAYEKDIRENCMKSGTTVESIEAKKLFEYELPLPDEREQKVIVGVIENLMCKEESAKQLAVQILKRIDIMKKSILAKVFRGELGTNNLEEESSVKLLKQILEQRKIK